MHLCSFCPATNDGSSVEILVVWVIVCSIPWSITVQSVHKSSFVLTIADSVGILFFEVFIAIVGGPQTTD